MVIVDTSIWIDFFKGVLSVKEKNALTALLKSRQVTMTHIIRHEILVGANHNRQYRELEELLSPIAVLTIPSGWWEKLSRFGFELRERGLAGRFTDLSIAYSAKEHGFPVWSADQYFSSLGRKRIIRVFGL